MKKTNAGINDHRGAHAGLVPVEGAQPLGVRRHRQVALLGLDLAAHHLPPTSPAVTGSRPAP